MADALGGLEAALADRYRIERTLGQGGMATVYLAQDLRHHRQVAVKVLRSEVTASLGSERFLREIDIAAGLTHPHILPVHDSGAAGDILYYVMPFVDGPSLRDRLEAEGRLPVNEALRIAREIGDALEHAHRHGVVHRDMKPATVLLSEGHCYVADFGIARTIDVAGSRTLTRYGTAIGTPDYMSPEQAMGEREVDGRSDIYSLGCVLYEMLAGSPPFAAATPQAVIVKRVTETARPIRQIRSEVPPGVERALAASLAIDADDRCQTASEFIEALTPGFSAARRAGSLLRRLRYGLRLRFYARPALASAVGAAALAGVVGLIWMAALLGGFGETAAPGSPMGQDAAPSETGVAILIFEDLSPQQSLDAYTAGFTKALIRSINSVEGLAAQSFQAVRRYRGSTASPDSIARALEVDYLVEGEVLPTALGFRVGVDLVNPETGVPVAQLQQEGASGDLAELIDAIAEGLALSLRPELGEQVRFEQLRAATTSDEALGLVWQAEALRRTATDLMLLDQPDRSGAESALVRADSLLVRAELLDPEWPAPSVQRGWVAHERAQVFTDVPKSYGTHRLELARAGLGPAERALELAPNEADALEIRGVILFALAQRERSDTVRDSLVRSAEQDLLGAVAANPRQVTAWRSLADLREIFWGDHEGARQALEQAYYADRFLADAGNIVVGLAGSAIEDLSDTADREEAWRWIDEGRRRWPDWVDFPALALLALASTYSAGDVERAWAYWDTVEQTQPGDRADTYRPTSLALIAAVLGQAGQGDSARAVIDRGLSAATPSDSTYAASYVARAYLTIGDTAQSLRWLARDLEAYPGKKPLRATESWFRALHGNPRFEELVGRPGTSD
jgi:serine/threonine-protein kinase